MTNAVVVGGLGVVGMATRDVFGVEYYIDLKENNISLKEAANQRYIFICLPTPVESGRYITDPIDEIIQGIHQHGKQNVFIIRSTVYAGYSRHLQEKFKTQAIISNPEFFTESTRVEDVKSPDLIVIGGDQRNYVDDVVGIYKSRYKMPNIVTSDSITAELIKLSVNAFYTTKVVFANQIYDYAQKAGANYETLKKAMYMRKWVGTNHLDVFHDGGRGAGGACLRKDTEALSAVSGSSLLKTVVDLNRHYLSGGGKE